MTKKVLFTLIFILYVIIVVEAQQNKVSTTFKPISKDLFGIFFEDINYAADGGLYAEMIQNRSFEYSPADRKEWNSFTAWDYLTDGFGYGTLSVETSHPLHPNNPHYAVLTIEEPGTKGIGLVNNGFDGIVVEKGAEYKFSICARLLSPQPVSISVQLRNKKGEVYAEKKILVSNKEWQQYSTHFASSANDENAVIAILATDKGKIAMDMVSLFPQNTFKGRDNGLRADVAQAIADLHPKFMRFPGGCLVHGDGLGNMYRWKNTIGPVEQRVDQKNIWGYHQSVGLGYYEYFQFCEDIGAKPLPVLAAAVSCQNSGGTWRIGGTGQHALAWDEMKKYIQDILDLIEWANGDATTKWGNVRASAGHPKPFNLKYIGIGNEDKQTDAFRERFAMIYAAIKQKHPEVTIVGTVGPAPDGEDFKLGWQFANEQKADIVDEHYYMKPEWFIHNQHRYDNYDRLRSKVYVGEYASQGNTLYNALCEAAYMTSLERNGDVVRFASYAPLLARVGHTQWNPDLIYFNKTKTVPTINYYVQQLFSTNEGDMYCNGVVTGFNDSTVASSCVLDSQSGDLIVKIINLEKENRNVHINLSAFKKLNKKANSILLSGEGNEKDSFENPALIIPQREEKEFDKNFEYTAKPISLTILRWHKE